MESSVDQRGTADQEKEASMVSRDFSHKSVQKARKVLYNLMEENPAKQIGNLSVYNIPMNRTHADVENRYQKFTFGKESVKVNEKVIMMVGETGSGKTTLINAMINYILGVEWEDKFRFKLTDEEITKSQAYSQTSMVTAYELHFQEEFRIAYPLTIIDTPGFGDTSGIKRDKEIMAQIKEFFSSSECIDHLNAVCFVVQASSARLSPTQKYIFHLILSIFGKDIADNILFLITFADVQAPLVLDGIKEAGVPCRKDNEDTAIHYKFNNSAQILSNNPDMLIINEKYWKMGADSMKSFFEHVDALFPNSLVLTKYVLRERAQLDAALQVLVPEIKAGLVKLEEMRKTEKALEQYQADMEKNKDFKFEVPIIYKIQRAVSSQSAMNCQNCNVTCHYPCKVVGNPFNYFCEVIGFLGDCKICFEECKVKDHKLEDYRWDTGVMIVQREYTDLKKNYEAAYGEAMTVERIVEKLQNEYEVVDERILNLIKKSSKCLQHLREIALKPDPVTAPDYIDLLIQGETMEAKRGYLERVEFLKKLREEAVILEKIENNENLLPEEYNKHKLCRARKLKVPTKLKICFYYCVAKLSKAKEECSLLDFKCFVETEQHHLVP